MFTFTIKCKKNIVDASDTFKRFIKRKAKTYEN